MAATDHPDFDLVPYIRGELSADERVQVERHLEHCADCRESAAASAAILAQVSRAIDEVHSPDWSEYRAELHRKLADRQSGGPAAQRWWPSQLRVPSIKWPAMALAGAVTAILAVAIVTHRGTGLEAPGVEELAMDQEMSGADMNDADVGLLANYRVVEHLDLLENYELIEHLDELGPGDRQNHETSS